ISPEADIAVTQTHSPDPVNAGANRTDTLNVANVTTNRFTIASGIKLTDMLAPGAVLVSATAAQGSCSLSNGVVTCDLGSLAPGGAVAVTIVVTPTLAGTITNLATVSANGPEINPADNTSTATTVVHPNADVAVLGSNAPNPVTLGSNLTYTVTVTNRGPSPATGILLTNTLPARRLAFRCPTSKLPPRISSSAPPPPTPVWCQTRTSCSVAAAAAAR